VLRTIVCLALALQSLGCFADPAAIARLGKLLEGMRQFEAAFHQTLLDENGELLQESDGRVTVRHPGRFRWQTIEPAEQLVVSDGSTVWQYDPDLMQAVVRPQDKRADQIPSLLLSGDIEAVSRVCEITLAPADRKMESFLLKPREDDGLFAALTIRFSDGVLHGLDIQDGMGQRTVVGFSNFRRRKKLDDALFEFEPPAGVDVVNDE
jgi:outer membrane lipoprotein carrier protein